MWPVLTRADLLAETCQPPQVVTAQARVVDLTQACDALRRWDPKAQLDSRGTALFQLFWSTLTESDLVWRQPFTPSDPVNTPRGLVANSPVIRQKLADAVLRMQAANLPSTRRSATTSS